MNYENFICAVAGVCEKYARTNPDMYVHLHIAPEGLTITHGSKEQMRKEWVDKMLTEYCEEYEDYSDVILSDKNRKIVVVHFEDCWGDESGYGIAKCSADDEFDENVGLAVAFAHFREYDIPDFV